MTETTRKNLGYQLSFIGFTSFISYLRMLHFAVFMHPRYLPRSLLVTFTSLISIPLRLWEKLRYGRKISAVNVASPIFVVGHWRSGTTHLHNLLSQDPNLGYLSVYQAMVPDCSLVSEKTLKPLLAKLVPVKRPMDNMLWPIDAPQEEEIALAKITPYSLYVRFLFPRKAMDFFRRYVLLENVSARVVAELKRKYMRLLQVATLHAGGRRLVLKNPVNTARIKLLLQWFPDAKFIHIYRSPYDVFISAVHMQEQMLPLTTLQRMPTKDRSEAVLSLYEEMMRRYLEERTLIPDGNLVEVCFEQLERAPMIEISKIYRSLSLDNYAAAEPKIRAYVDAQKNYQKNNHRISAADKKRVEERWSFTLRAFGYGPETVKG